MDTKDSSQLWMCDDKSLKSKGDVWMSEDKWRFKNTADRKFMYIENISNKKFLTANSNGTVIEEDYEDDKTGQLWKRGKPNIEGYFTLENYMKTDMKSTFLTSTSIGTLEIKGKELEFI